MLSLWQTAMAGFEAALSGMAAPWLICLVLVLTTLLVEDLAIAAGVAVATQGSLSWPLAFSAVAGGIAAGDLALYGLGLSAARWSWLRARLGDARLMLVRQHLARRLPGAVLLARVVPGLRLLTYTACGLFRVPLLAFAGWVTLAVLLWTAGLFWIAAALGEVLARALDIPPPIAVALPILVLAALMPLRRYWRDRSGRKPT
ncbi:MAG: VTT domain-containing protein [Rhizobacter sp.]|nr:VTT domain-containing protein [Rhizobacter sp.]